MLKRFNKNVIEGSIREETLKLLESQNNIPKDEEGDFVKALISSAHGYTISDLHFLIDINSNYGGQFRKIESKTAQHLVLLQVALLYSFFLDLNGFFDSYGMDSNRVEEYITNAFKDLGKPASTHLENFKSLKKKLYNPFNYYETQLLELLEISDPAARFGLMVKDAETIKILNPILSSVIQTFKKLE